ncbi:MAG: (d)CMP kinase [Cytophagales bacterium]|nr:(d)CMP kinase [Cytophagales bacterium]
MNKIVIAIDGYSACGKSTTAKEVAKALGYTYIDSGAMYRAVTLYFHENHISLTNDKEIAKAIENIEVTFRYDEEAGKNLAYLNGLNVENEIREMYVSENVSQVSRIKAVREALVLQQQKLGKKKGVVMDGRDIGTVVFPNAELKIFMLADLYVRAARRQNELLGKDQMVDLEQVKKNLATRDSIDTTREVGPLKQADDAVVLDTTFMTLEEQVDEVVNLALSKIVKEKETRMGS